MTEDTPPPTPLPPAAQAPYPAHPAPQEHKSAPLKVAKPAPPPAIGALGAGLIGGALAAAIGLAFGIPLLRRRAAQKETARKAATRRRRTVK